MSDLDRKQALLLLNEHVGQRVHAAVELDIGFGYQAVMSACGVLVEMRPPEGKQPATPTLPDDGPTGLYRFDRHAKRLLSQECVLTAVTEIWRRRRCGGSLAG